MGAEEAPTSGDAPCSDAPCGMCFRRAHPTVVTTLLSCARLIHLDRTFQPHYTPKCSARRQSWACILDGMLPLAVEHALLALALSIIRYRSQHIMTRLRNVSKIVMAVYSRDEAQPELRRRRPREQLVKSVRENACGQLQRRLPGIRRGLKLAWRPSAG